MHTSTRAACSSGANDQLPWSPWSSESCLRRNSRRKTIPAKDDLGSEGNDQENNKLGKDSQCRLVQLSYRTGSAVQPLVKLFKPLWATSPIPTIGSLKIFDFAITLSPWLFSLVLWFCRVACSLQLCFTYFKAFITRPQMCLKCALTIEQDLEPFPLNLR